MGDNMITAGRNTVIPDDIKVSQEWADVSFGNFCSIASGLRIVTGQHPIVEHPECVSQFPFHERWNAPYYPCKMKGEIVVGNDVWIGENVTLLDGVTIGNGAIIGAGSVVVSDVDTYSLVAGNPARFKRFRFTPRQVMDLNLISWWDLKDDIIKEIIPYMKDVTIFLKYYADNPDKFRSENYYR